MIETLILLGCLYLSIRVTDYIEKQKQNNNNLKCNIMERRNDIPNLLAMYIRNTMEIYNITSWLHALVCLFFLIRLFCSHR